MKIAMKAALLSALVFPGAGHLFLKKYPTGMALVSTFLLAFYFLSIDLLDKVDALLKQIESGHIPLTVPAITELISNQSMGMDTQTASFITSALGVLWLIAIWDAYRIGRHTSRTSLNV
ncbi:hypothetical protein [Psychromonas sp. Urea-02u-13]|uniref:hypothetical protein n=1 Tax=Psychromonas sp. Urea-02u-13 TaxID=2058326 RepID=UPI000C342FD8|nr:hypothetical protein [Psychromonas sp. Urea-02u-13]PKG37704.1 hypothetical protein CXF74_17360 [Psychromonas sp. Urea-02u-13]